MEYTKRSSCNICIVKSIRNSKNKYRIGNMFIPNSIYIKNNTIENIAATVRNSYIKKTIITKCNIFITSWIPHKKISQNITSISPSEWYNNINTNYSWGYNYNCIILFFDRLTNKYNCFIENKS